MPQDSFDPLRGGHPRVSPANHCPRRTWPRTPDTPGNVRVGCRTHSASFRCTESKSRLRAEIQTGEASGNVFPSAMPKSAPLDALVTDQ